MSSMAESYEQAKQEQIDAFRKAWEEFIRAGYGLLSHWFDFDTNTDGDGTGAPIVDTPTYGKLFGNLAFEDWLDNLEGMVEGEYRYDPTTDQ